jgi:MarR family transcriptional regulator, organic hydroperoxide resistance regulator
MLASESEHDFRILGAWLLRDNGRRVFFAGIDCFLHRRAERFVRARVRRGGAPAGRSSAKSSVYEPPLTTSRRDLIIDGTDEGFRDIIYQMVLGLQHLFSCREIFGRHLNLTGSQFAVLMGVAYRQKTNGVSIQDLADHIRLAQPHVTTEVGRLLAKGLLVKKPNPRDQRSVLVSLSKRGHRAVDDVVPLVRNVNDLLFAGISKRQLLTVMRVMRTLTHNAEHSVAGTRRATFTKGTAPRAGQNGAGLQKAAAAAR